MRLRTKANATDDVDDGEEETPAVRRLGEMAEMDKLDGRRPRRREHSLQSGRVPMSVPLVYNPLNQLNTSTSSTQSSNPISPQLHTSIPLPPLPEAVVFVPFLAAHPLDTAPIAKHETRGPLTLVLGAPTCTPTFHRQSPPTPCTVPYALRPASETAKWSECGADST